MFQVLNKTNLSFFFIKQLSCNRLQQVTTQSSRKKLSPQVITLELTKPQLDLNEPSHPGPAIFALRILLNRRNWITSECP